MTVSAATPPVVWACPTGTISYLNDGTDHWGRSAVISGAVPLTLLFTRFSMRYHRLHVFSCSTVACIDKRTLDDAMNGLSSYSSDVPMMALTSSTGIILIEEWLAYIPVPSWSATWTSPKTGQCARRETLGRAL